LLSNLLTIGKECQKNEAEALKTREVAAKNFHEMAREIVTKPRGERTSAERGIDAEAASRSRPTEDE
jgi:hypothetical protein